MAIDPRGRTIMHPRSHYIEDMGRLKPLERMSRSANTHLFLASFSWSNMGLRLIPRLNQSSFSLPIFDRVLSSVFWPLQLLSCRTQHELSWEKPFSSCVPFFLVCRLSSLPSITSFPSWPRCFWSRPPPLRLPLNFLRIAILMIFNFFQFSPFQTQRLDIQVENHSFWLNLTRDPLRTKLSDKSMMLSSRLGTSHPSPSLIYA